jgi:uncharacterized membrane protein YeaQ/YmgE (transglycosylase-associated protein family)
VQPSSWFGSIIGAVIVLLVYQAYLNRSGRGATLRR